MSKNWKLAGLILTWSRIYFIKIVYFNIFFIICFLDSYLWKELFRDLTFIIKHSLFNNFSWHKRKFIFKKMNTVNILNFLWRKKMKTFLHKLADKIEEFTKQYFHSNFWITELIWMIMIQNYRLNVLLTLEIWLCLLWAKKKKLTTCQQLISC